MKQILSYYLICYHDNSSLIIPVLKKRLSGGVTLSSYLTGLPILLSLQVEPSINYQLYTQFLTITVTVYFLLFSPVEANGFLMPKLSKMKDLIFFIYSGRNSINFELRSLTLSSTSKEVNTLLLSRIIRLTD